MANSYGEILAFLQDGTAGISLISRNGSLMRGKFRRGDLLKATGIPTRDLGTDEVVLLNFERIGESAPPSAIPVRVSDAFTETYAGRLVRITGNLLPLDASLVVRLRDTTGTIDVSPPVEVPLDKEAWAHCVDGGRQRSPGSWRFEAQMESPSRLCASIRAIQVISSSFRFPPID